MHPQIGADSKCHDCRAGVSPAIERFTLAGLRLGESYGSESETPALHPEVQKQVAFGMTPPKIALHRSPNPGNISNILGLVSKVSGSEELEKEKE
jgi:hypothetical protein